MNDDYVPSADRRDFIAILHEVALERVQRNTLPGSPERDLAVRNIEESARKMLEARPGEW